MTKLWRPRIGEKEEETKSNKIKQNNDRRFYFVKRRMSPRDLLITTINSNTIYNNNNINNTHQSWYFSTLFAMDTREKLTLWTLAERQTDRQTFVTLGYQT